MLAGEAGDRSPFGDVKLPTVGCSPPRKIPWPETISSDSRKLVTESWRLWRDPLRMWMAGGPGGGRGAEEEGTSEAEGRLNDARFDEFTGEPKAGEGDVPRLAGGELGKAPCGVQVRGATRPWPFPSRPGRGDSAVDTPGAKGEVGARPEMEMDARDLVCP